MSSPKLSRIILLLVLGSAGVWLLSRPAMPAPETVARQQGLRSLLAPAGAPAPPSDAAPSDDAAPTLYEAPIEPVTVDLADVPPGVYDPHNTYDAFRRGDIDMDQEYRLSAVEIAALREAAMALPADDGVAPLRQRLNPADDALALQSDFDALDAGDCCGGGTSVPPDSHLAAGPNHLLAAVNVAFEIYDKAGNIVQPATTFGEFFGALPDCNGGDPGAFDPTVLYDEEANRFLLGVDGNGTDFCIAVSASGDPTGSWRLYAIPADIGGAFHDYPHTGVGQEAIFVGANQFFSSTSVEARFWALDKAAMYAGQTLQSGDVVTFSAADLGFPSDGSPQPLHLHGHLQNTWPGHNTHYFVSDTYDGRTLHLWAWPNALGGGTPAVVATFDLEAASGVTSGFPVPAPQQGGDNVEANDWRFRGFEYRNGYGWTADTVACNPGGGAVDCVRFAQIDLRTSPPTLVQAAVYGSDGGFRTFPDLAANHCNDMAIGYNYLSASTWPQIRVTGRESTDAAGTLQGEIVLKTSEEAYVSNVGDDPPYRWGDYSSMAIDPDGRTFWHIGEYAKNVGGSQANWGNYVGSFAFPDCRVLDPEDFPEHLFLPAVAHPEPAPTPAPTPTPTASEVVIMSDNFEGAFPGDWEVEDANSDGGEQFWDKSGCRAQSSGNSAWAVGNGGPGCGEAYPNNVESWMVYGPFDLSDATDAALNFAFWSNTESGYDVFFWGASDDGNNFSGYAVTGAVTSWNVETLSLASDPNLGDLRGDSSVWIAFVFASDEVGNELEGSYVDNVVLWKTTDGSAAPVESQLTPGPGRTLETARFTRP